MSIDTLNKRYKWVFVPLLASFLAWLQGCGLVYGNRENPQQLLQWTRAQYASHFDYTINLPKGWGMAEDPKLGKWEVTLSKEEDAEEEPKVGGTFRVYALDRAFGYRGEDDVWEFVSKNVVPRAGVTIPLKSFKALNMPAGWQVRVTNNIYDPGRAVWILHTQGDFVFMYIFFFVPTLAEEGAGVNSDFNKGALSNRTFLDNRAAIEYIIAHTQIRLKH